MHSRRESHDPNGAFPEQPGETAVRATWRNWRAELRSLHLDGLAAWLLEAGGPLAFLSAQLLYMGEPLLGPRVKNLAQILESADMTREFTAYLTSESRESQDAPTGIS